MGCAIEESLFDVTTILNAIKIYVKMFFRNLFTEIQIAVNLQVGRGRKGLSQKIKAYQQH